VTAGLYIHIPFCEKRCGYCDFYTVAETNPRIPEYLQAVENEIALHADCQSVKNLTFSTLYLGGGTPSLLSVRQLSRLLEIALTSFRFSPSLELTIEMNPGTVDLNKLLAYKNTGINRLSIGIQSFHTSELAFLDRIHSAEEAVDCFLNARKAGFDNISIDLIFALPRQSPKAWAKNLALALELAPEHISAYSLTVEPGTPLMKQLHRKAFTISKEKKQREMQLNTMRLLEEHGYEQYEISNYCKAGFASQHNQKYWDGSPYLGLGASAHSFIDGRRFWNVSNYSDYIAKLQQDKLPRAGHEHLSSDDVLLEKIWLGLRQKQGVHLASVETETGVSLLNQCRATLQKFFLHESFRQSQISGLTNGSLAVQSRHLVIEDGFLRLTEEGILLCDAICAEFL
jgi:oxygen-independent coproporphyrinogen-3 oxidase